MRTINIADNNLHPDLSLPIDGLPETIQNIIKELADVFQCPKDFIVAGVYAAISATIGKRLQCFDGKYYNFPQLWICNIGRSGIGKTPPIEWLFAPIDAIDCDNYTQYETEKKEYNRRLKDGENVEAKPYWKQIIIRDSTPEARYKCLAQNPKGLLLYNDEIQTFFGNFNRYNKSGEESQFLSIFSNSNITINRKGDEPILIAKPFLSIFGGIQPSLLCKTFGNSQMMDNGFNARWLFCFPDDCAVPKYSEKTMPPEYAQQWSNFINLLNGTSFEQYATIPFTPPAKKIYINYYNNHLKPKMEQSNDYLGSVYSKFNINIERWALITAIMRRETSFFNITDVVMEYSVRCMYYFEQCAEKVYNNIVQAETKPSKTEAVKNLIKTFDGKIENQSALARALDFPQSKISKIMQWYNGIGIDSDKANSNNGNSESELYHEKQGVNS